MLTSRPDIPISRSVAFPDLEPAALAARRRSRTSKVIDRSLELTHIELTHDSAHDEETDPSKREETRNEVARLTVYVMNGILFFISFPVGMAILVFNILGGENLRTTAHAIALAGMATALAMTDLGQTILSVL